jgi:hypothetical protein
MERNTDQRASVMHRMESEKADGGIGRTGRKAFCASFFRTVFPHFSGFLAA